MLNACANDFPVTYSAIARRSTPVRPAAIDSIGPLSIAVSTRSGGHRAQRVTIRRAFGAGLMTGGTELFVERRAVICGRSRRDKHQRRPGQGKNNCPRAESHGPLL